MNMMISFGIRSYLMIAAFTDLRWGRIPNLLTALGALAAFSCSILVYGWQAAGGGILRSLVLLIILYPLFLMGVIGAGDVKLFSVCALLMPMPGLGHFLLFSLIWGGVFSLLKMLQRKQLMFRLRRGFMYIWDMLRARRIFRYETECSADSCIPFGVCIFLGYLVTTVWI